MARKILFQNVGRMLVYLQKLVTNISSREERYFLSKNEISCSSTLGLCMVMKEKQQGCVDFYNGYSGFGKIFLSSFSHPSCWNLSALVRASVPVRVLFQLLSYLTGRSVHFEGNLNLPLASFQFTSKFSLIFVPFPSTFCVLLPLPALNCLFVPLPLSPSLISPHILSMSFPSVNLLRKHLRANSSEAVSLWHVPLFTAYDMISYISARNHRINI